MGIKSLYTAVKQHGSCKPVTWLYLYIHSLKNLTFSGVSRRWRGMNFNYT